jgi:hypothetical protein
MWQLGNFYHTLRKRWKTKCTTQFFFTIVQKSCNSLIHMSSDVKNFYTINLPSIQKTMYTDPNTSCVNFYDECTGAHLCHLTLHPLHSGSCLPPRLCGDVPKLSAGDLLDQKQYLKILKERLIQSSRSISGMSLLFCTLSLYSPFFTLQVSHEKYRKRRSSLVSLYRIQLHDVHHPDVIRTYRTKNKKIIWVYAMNIKKI